MAVSFVAAGTTDESATSPVSIDLGFPAGLAADDILVAQVFSRNTISTITPPAGWTLADSNPRTSTSHRQWRYWKVATGSESGTETWSISGSALFMGRMYAFRGVNTSAPFESENVATGTDDTIECPSVTTSGADGMAVALVSVADDDTLADFTGETGGDYTRPVSDYATTTGLDGTLSIQTAAMASAGTISGAAVTMSAADAWLCESFGLRASGTAAVPDAPTLDSATAGDTEVDLAWTAPASDGGSAITGYKVYRGTTTGGETLHDTVGVVLTYNDSGLTNGTTYFYKVSAVNAAGEGDLSNERSATPTASPPGGATGVSLLADYGDPAANGCPVVLLAYVEVGGSPATDYGPLDIRYQDPDDPDNTLHFATPTGTNAPSTPADTGYTGDDGYAVAQVTSADTVDPYALILIDAITGNVIGGGPSVQWSGVGACQSFIPSSPVLSGDSPASPGTEAALDWTASTFADARTTFEYAVLRGTANPPTAVVASGLSATSYDDSGLTAGVTYYYRIRTTYRHPGHAEADIYSNIVAVEAGAGESAALTAISVGARFPRD